MMTDTPHYTARKITDTIAIHCAETSSSQDIGAAEIRDWHVHERGWIDIGYHIVIRRSGRIEYGRPLWAVGAHVEGHNSTSVAVCMVGGSDGRGGEQDNFTPNQWIALGAVVRMLLAAPTFNITTIKGHRQFDGVKKFCPAFDVTAWKQREGL